MLINRYFQLKMYEEKNEHNFIELYVKLCNKPWIFFQTYMTQENIEIIQNNN